MEYPLSRGQKLSDQKVDHLKEKSNETLLLNKILNYISYRHRSKEEIKTKFKKQGFKFDLINSAIIKLENLGYIDDTLFTKMLIKSLVKNKKLGRNAVIYKLIPHRLDNEVVNKILDQMYVDNPIKVLLEYHTKKFFKVKDKTKKNKIKLHNLLKRKGFNYSDFEHFINYINWN